MSTLKTVFCVLLALIALPTMLGNARTTFQYVVSKKTGSLVPVLGGISGAGAMLLAPWSLLNQWAWVPLVLDPGSLPMVAMAVWMWLRRMHRGS